MTNRFFFPPLDFLHRSITYLIRDHFSTAGSAPLKKAVADSGSATVGTIATGTYASTQAEDDTEWEIIEVTATPAFTLTMDVTAPVIGQSATKLTIVGFYVGNPAHTVNVNAWDYVTSGYDLLGTIPSGVAEDTYNFTLDADHTDTDGSILIQITHISPGNVTHSLHLDHVYVLDPVIAADPGPGTFTLVDTENKVSIVAGELVFDGGHSTPQYGDPAIWYDQVATRAPGLLLLGDFNSASAAHLYLFGFDTNKAVGPVSGFWQSASHFKTYDEDSAVFEKVYAIVNATEYRLCVALSAAGVHMFVRDAGSWHYLGHWGTETAASLYAGISNYSAELTVDNIVQPSDKLWLPSPLLSDGFSAALPTAVDSGSNGLDGTHTRVAVDDDGAFYDGLISYTNIYSAVLNTLWNGDEFTFIQRLTLKILDPTYYAFPVVIYSDGNNVLSIKHSAGALTLARIAGSVRLDEAVTSLAIGTIYTVGLTASVSSDEQKTFLDGVQDGSTQNGLSAWAAVPLNSSICTLGARDAGHLGYEGRIADTILSFGVVATPAQMATIDTHLDAGTLTTTILDGIFGAGKYAWWKLDETIASDGLGHAEGVAGSLGAGGGGAAWNNSTFTNDSGEVLASPPGGGELFTDGDMEDDPATNWTAVSGAVLSNVAEERTGGSGSQCLKIARGGEDYPYANQSPSGNNIYLLSGWVKNGDASWIRLGWNSGLRSASSNLNATTSWVFHALSGLSTGASFHSYAQVQATGADGTYALVDDMSSQALAVEDCITTFDAGLSDVLLSVDITLPYRTYTGFIFNLDSTTSPNNYTLVMIDGDNTLAIWKCVAGTLSRLSGTAAAYSAGSALRVRKSGNEVWAYYNNVFIAKATISDAGIVDNTIHGLFSTYVTATLDNATIFGEGAAGEWSTLNRFDS